MWPRDSATKRPRIRQQVHVFTLQAEGFADASTAIVKEAYQEAIAVTAGIVAHRGDLVLTEYLWGVLGHLDPKRASSAPLKLVTLPSGSV